MSPQSLPSPTLHRSQGCAWQGRAANPTSGCALPRRRRPPGTLRCNGSPAAAAAVGVRRRRRCRQWCSGRPGALRPRGPRRCARGDGRRCRDAALRLVVRLPRLRSALAPAPRVPAAATHSPSPVRCAVASAQSRRASHRSQRCLRAGRASNMHLRRLAGPRPPEGPTPAAPRSCAAQGRRAVAGWPLAPPAAGRSRLERPLAG
mmetsp:Transcript_56871/g.157393  ORF Transcript_56871/g.157393 Transcript_56871/m.157393 type:complete len:204 (+) Transcript_56871:40-651(+)